MKTKKIWYVLFLAITSLLLLQSIWLYNTYILKRVELEKLSNTVLSESIEKELIYRIEINEIDNVFEIVDKDSFHNDPEYKDLEEQTFSKKEAIEAGIYQFVLHSTGSTFKISTLDSIFRSELQNANLSLKYFLIYRDSMGGTLEQVGDLSISKIESAFHTESFLIINGTRVQAIVDISLFSIFKQMIGLLIASFIMLIILIFCVFYQTKFIFDQYKLNKLREDFSHALTHDLRTPLNSIYATLHNLKNGTFDSKPEIRERHGNIAINQVTNILSLVDRILKIAQFEDGVNVINRENTDLHKIVTEIEERFSVINAKPVDIQTSFNFDEEVYIDGAMIKDAINNLVDNAIKYSGESVAININCNKSDKNLRISVSDNGFGISEKNKKIIFDKYERGAAVGKKGAKGFGLGLNYVKHVVKAHDGIITINSIEGHGSEFVMSITL
jgi:Osmosensitive K+ channel histidine kinase